jgi:hypothetical protein
MPLVSGGDNGSPSVVERVLFSDLAPMTQDDPTQLPFMTSVARRLPYNRCFGRTVRSQAPVLDRLRSAHQELPELGLGGFDDLLVRSLN